MVLFVWYYLYGTICIVAYYLHCRANHLLFLSASFSTINNRNATYDNPCVSLFSAVIFFTDFSHKNTKVREFSTKGEQLHISTRYLSDITKST